METNESLRKIVAELLRMDLAAVTAETALDSFLKNSVSRAMLQARLRRELGTMPTSVVGVRSFSDLESLVTGSSTISNPAQATKVTAPVGSIGDQGPGVACGIDIERIENLPDAADYWEHPFYRDTFTDAEIAECVARPSPKDHFAARWSAKEALMKCDGRYVQVNPREIEVRVDEHGRPALFDLRTSPAHQVGVSTSLSHADGLAVAIVVQGASFAPANGQHPLVESVAVVPPPSKSSHSLLAWAGVILGLVSLVMAAIALVSD